MIPRVNLLPWRRTQRIRRALWFISSLAGTGLLSVALVYAATMPVQREVDVLARTVADKRMEADHLRQAPPVAALLRQRDATLARLRELRTLQSERLAIARVMELTLRETPPGIVLTDIAYAPGRVATRGWARQGEALAEYLNRLRDWHLTDEVRLDGMGGDAAGRRRFEVSLVLAAEPPQPAAAPESPE